MQKVSDVFVPDYQQSRNYHQELLKTAAQERQALEAMKSRKHGPASFRGLGLWQLFRARLTAREFAEGVSRTSNAQT
jgi:hypothetical protein